MAFSLQILWNSFCCLSLSLWLSCVIKLNWCHDEALNFCQTSCSRLLKMRLAEARQPYGVSEIGFRNYLAAILFSFETWFSNYWWCSVAIAASKVIVDLRLNHLYSWLSFLLNESTTFIDLLILTVLDSTWHQLFYLQFQARLFSDLNISFGFRLFHKSLWILRFFHSWISFGCYWYRIDFDHLFLWLMLRNC